MASFTHFYIRFIATFKTAKNKSKCPTIASRIKATEHMQRYDY